VALVEGGSGREKEREARSSVPRKPVPTALMYDSLRHQNLEHPSAKETRRKYLEPESRVLFFFYESYYNSLKVKECTVSCWALCTQCMTVLYL